MDAESSGGYQPPEREAEVVGKIAELLGKTEDPPEFGRGWQSGATYERRRVATWLREIGHADLASRVEEGQHRGY